MQEWMAAKKHVSKPRPGPLELKNNLDSLNSEVTNVTFTSVARQSSLKQKCEVTPCKFVFPPAPYCL